MQATEIGGVWWRTVTTPRHHAFALLILAGIILEVVVHFLFGIAVVYTHFYYLIIVIAGLWYGRRAVLIAIFFGALHIADSWIVTGLISPDPFVRAGMFVIVALIVGMTKEQSDAYHRQLIARNRELEEANTLLETSKSAYETANRKLNLLSSITRHDIRNQLLALLGFLGLSRTKATDPELIRYIDREEAAALTIQRQIDFTKSYEEIGVRAPQWQDIRALALAMQARAAKENIAVTVETGGIEIYADPLLEKVFENLIDNSMRHGERVRNISFTTLPYGLEYLAIVYQDDGIGIHEEDKERIFEKGFGKNTGLGLFLSREILSITGIAIKESGAYGKGARFEIMVPRGRYRAVRTPQKEQE